MCVNMPFIWFQILEVCTETVPSPGTRVCAYWSQQYRCLYPGTVPVPSADDTDSRFVCVEFDDGDSGRINLEDIRLLPQNYPVVGESVQFKPLLMWPSYDYEILSSTLVGLSGKEDFEVLTSPYKKKTILISIIVSFHTFTNYTHLNNNTDQLKL